MFYCDPCAEKHDWPIGGFHSYGRCEMCGKTRDCSDRPSSSLPLPKEEKRGAAAQRPRRRRR